jgi:hypothetical protein
MRTWASTAVPAELEAAIFKEQSETEQQTNGSTCFGMLIHLGLIPAPLLQSAAMALLRALVADPGRSAGTSNGDITESAHGLESLAKRRSSVQSTVCTALHSALKSLTSLGLERMLEAHSGLLQFLEVLALGVVAMPLHGEEKGCALLDGAWELATELLSFMAASSTKSAAEIQSNRAHATQILPALLRLVSIIWVQRQKDNAFRRPSGHNQEMGTRCLDAILAVPTKAAGIDCETKEV